MRHDAKAWVVFGVIGSVGCIDLTDDIDVFDGAHAAELDPAAADPADTDEDGIPDVADADDDGDGVCDDVVPVRVMAVGDSITMGSPEYVGSYRRWISYLAPNLLFVGSQTDPVSAEWAGGWHEGYSGYTTSQARAKALKNAPLYEPSIVLWMTGTNDITLDIEDPAAVYQAALDVLALPSVEHVIVSAPPPRKSTIPKYEQTLAFIAALREEFAEPLPQGLHFTDAGAVIDDSLLYDGYHPKTAGYELMGDVWFQAIQALGVRTSLAGTDGECIPGPDPSPLDATSCGDVDGDGCDDCTTGAFSPDRDGDDFDRDGLCDAGDDDSDADAIPEALENSLGVRPESDEDGDGVPNHRDADLVACVERGATCDPVATVFDIDQDGAPNHLDLDADGDQIADLIEAGQGARDADRDGQRDELSEGNSQDLFTAIRQASAAPRTLADTDQDGEPDVRDLDADGDSVLDRDEAGAISVGERPVDTDHDAVPDYLDLDSDADGVDDLHDNCRVTANRDQADVDADGVGDACSAPDLAVGCSAARGGSLGTWPLVLVLLAVGALRRRSFLARAWAAHSPALSSCFRAR